MDSTSAVRPQSPRSPRSAGSVDSRRVRQDDSVQPEQAVQESNLDHSLSATRLQLSSLYRPIIAPLAEVESRLDRELRSPHGCLSPVLSHGTQLGGKRLRPAMLLLAGSAVGQVDDSHVVLGTVIEMVHTATLIHDDVLDQADTRRHVPTINARWDGHTSILLGDYLFAQSFRLAATLPSTEACRMIGEAARLVCEGELRQVLTRDVLDIDEPTYMEIIRSKTAELCRIACQLGAKFSGGDPAIVDALGGYGNAVGIAFQIADDFLDLWGDDETVGKTLGTDLEQGKLTLPVIRLLATCRPADRAAIIDMLRGPAQQRHDGIREYLDNSDARQYTRQVARRYRDQAINQLKRLDDSPAKESLTQIANFSVQRKF